MTDPAPAGFVPGRHLIDSYGRGGFRFGGMSHRGSILILPSGISAWPVESAAGIDRASLRPVLDADDVEFLLIGTGPEIAILPERLRLPFRERGISVDTMATGAAARTYNVLLAENRRVAAALIAVA
ncbi:Mth938-like domain-containing protein [Enterovirga sp.]|uniref:Mth938-like domain-containing protein n=1 Tax=Enterovirga sp. TaxID=2026350 RepID=UPI0026305873|nr:Mth938-like domain-containing protein [Enterovirga sp.]MDB5591896.1 hypothetical protein [Enterovirga sp.]